MSKYYRYIFLLSAGLTLDASPLAPSNLELKALSSSSVSIKWKDNSDDESGFKIFRDDELIKTLPANTIEFIDNNLNPNTTYKYTVKATNNIIDEPNLSKVHISEVLADNIDVRYDKDFYKFSDYIELRNYDNKAIDIGGYTISDNKSSWKIPDNTIIEANGYLLIWADNEDKKAKELHTNFKLSQKKESITLKDKNSNVIESFSFKKIESGVSIRSVDGKIAYMNPTPLGDNSTMYEVQEISKKVNFSISSGFYSQEKSLSLSIDEEGDIYYTTDGSTPTKKSKKYTSPINISKTTVVKARAFAQGRLPNKVITNSYIINFSTTLPVISLSLNSKYIYDDYVGIYVDGKNGAPSTKCYYHLNDEPKDYKNFNQDWERPVYIEYFDNSHNRVFKIDADISIAGQCSRYRAKKSFSIEFEDKLEYKLYEDKPDVVKFEDMKIRTGEAGYKITDILATKLVVSGNLNVDYQAYRAVQMFIDGEYWGVYNLREKKGKDYIKANYPDVKSSNLDIIAHVNGGDIAKYGLLDEFKKFKKFVENNSLTSSTNYEKILEMVDIDNYIDYMAVMIYTGNEDWIYNNTRWWIDRGNGGKWRWMLDDLDGAFTYKDIDTFDLAKRTSTFMSKFFNKLLANSTFKSRFKDRFKELLNTTFSQNSIEPYVDELSDERRDYFDLEKSKWGIDNGNFNYGIKQIRRFISDRVSVVRSQLDEL